MARIVSEATKRHPTIYQLYENGEHLMLGCDVGYCMGYYRGNLYKRYPSLWRKVLSSEEREIMGTLCVGNRTLSNMGTMVVRASEAMEVLSGNGDYYRKKDTDVANTNNQNKEAINVAFRRRHSSNVDKSIIKNMTYEPAARLRNDERNKENWDRLRCRVKEVATKPCSIPSVELDSPAIAVMNSVCFDAADSHAKKKKRNDEKAREIVVKQLWPSTKLYDDHNVPAVHEAANEEVDLIPIRFDLDIDGQKLRDTFTWNKNEKLITPESFAEALCHDLNIPTSSFVPAIVSALKTQIKEHSAAESDANIPDFSDQRILIKLNLHVGNVSLQDQFEWDISEPLNDPELFAQSLCTDLGLGGEFVTAIAYSIRGQLNWYRKTCSYREDPLPAIEIVFRTGLGVERWCPYVETLTDQEMEKKLKNQDRSTRRMRRLANSAPYSFL